ncbi:hypothetical protein GUITHDRAFT_85170 [Guillardia theta CCMP2712]|uniref:S1-like domain-containing protein n=2 Tax=Guillardia theta TaxID=55529 RepID=L1JRX2_GUITC|nr:hypothetical protein GUITHDRAFT_85170 [Guillardia theta CCMP2712]EKX51291.1 hypothetical protein GUITHDRAFT_85170 [Guillardia theta CCMP2712]|mmetsp:Transcript_49574/g.155293  ORF Transcript_49574/g.155293 Transcript_49574/m.155293 type:complete len:180 (+) Transcript_49574:132-671(+)|eukprot:XP_005838271.1 hypothetical protein GUITHDRAFT_85170 [Guillardia theta CCMP2712]
MGKRSQFVSKHVRLTAEHGFPEPKDNEFIVRLVRSRGGNTMECECEDGQTILCWLPAKFSKVVWAQRGDFLIVAPNAKEESSKVAATISHILFPEQVQHLRKLSCWPAGFDSTESRQEGSAASSRPSQAVRGDDEEDGEDSDGSGSDPDLFVNQNRLHDDSFEESESDEAEEEEGEENI